MTASKILLYFCLSFVAGIFLDSYLLTFLPGSEIYFLLPGLILGIILISTLWKYKTVVVIGFCILFSVLGIWKHQEVKLQITNSKLQIYSGGEVSLIGIVSTEPEIKEKSQRLTVKIDNEKVLITTSRYPEYKYGDKLEITGKLEIPSEDINGFNYKEYLKKDGIYYVMGFPKINSTGQNYGNVMMKTLFSFKNKFKAVGQQFIPPPQEGFLEALIFGDEENISTDWKNKLNLTGTRHITAVSGMNTPESL